MAITFLDTVDFGKVPVLNLVSQVVTSLPSWVAADEGRIVYNSTDQTLYYGSNSGWQSLDTGAGNVLNTLTLSAGAGLTGGGDLSANRTFDIGAGTGITVNADDIAVDTTWGDARYATLSGATFTGDVSLGTVQLIQGSSGLGDPSGMTASMWKSALTSAGITADGVYAFEDGSIAAQITAGGRLHVTVTQGTGLYKAETSSADNTYHAVAEYGPSGVALWLNNAGGFPTQGSSYGQSPTVRGNLTVDGTTTLNTEPTLAAHGATKNYVDTADATKADTSTTITAGNGLTGGGDLSTGRTLDVGAGAGISVAADSVAVDTTWGDARYAVRSGSTTMDVVTIDTLVVSSDVTTDGIFVVAAGVADMGGNRVQGVASPTASTDAANKQYVDLTAQGLAFKDAVVVVSTSNITLSGTQTIDGVGVVADDRVLVAGQTNAVENGIYVVAAGAWSRATDADASGEIGDGTVVPVAQGTAGGDSLYIATATASVPWVPGTDTSTWTKFTSITDLTAGAGMTKTGTTIDVVAADSSLTVNADSIAVASAPILTTARDISLTGDVTGTVSFDGSQNVSITSTVTSDIPRKYAANVGAGTSVAITHNLGTTDVKVEVFEISSGSTVLCDVTRTNTNTVTLGFASSVSADTYRVVVVG